jgi:TonB family protein
MTAVLERKNLWGSGLSLVLHALFFISAGVSFNPAEFSVDSGLSALEVHMLASSVKSDNIEVTHTENPDSDFIIKKAKKKKPVIQPVRAAAAAAEGKSQMTVQSEKSGALTEAKPAYLKNPSPVYPASAKNQGQQGLVQIVVAVNSDGSVKQVSLKKSSGFILLDDAAVRAVKNWQFMPASKNGIQIESQVEIPIRFKLAKGDDSGIVVN